MKVRPLRSDELGVGRKFVYYKNYNDKTDVTLMGFVRSYKSPFEEEDNFYDAVCVVQRPDGEIILALEKQLFVRVQ